MVWKYKIFVLHLNCRNKPKPQIIMKNFTLIIGLLVSTLNAQIYIDMTKELSSVSGHLTIDGTQIQVDQKNNEQVIITGKDLVLNDRSSFLFRNVILKLSGEIIVNGSVRPKLMDSYIFCEKSKALKSPNIIVGNTRQNVQVSNVGYIQKIKGDPVLWIYDLAGKRVFKGKKSESIKKVLPMSRYDVKILGVGFESKVLFVEM